MPAEHLLEQLKIGVGQLRQPIPAGILPSSTAVTAPLDSIAGQSRAQEALAFGLAMTADGYNIAASGPPASGRSMVIHWLVEAAAAQRPPSRDWCYVHNFAEPRRPKAVPLPPAAGDDFQRGLSALVDACRNALPRAFDTDSYSTRHEQVLEPFGRQRQTHMEELERLAHSRGFALNATPIGLIPVPLGRDGNPIGPEAFAALPEPVRQRLSQESDTIQDAIGVTMRELRRIDADARRAVEALDRDVTRFVVGPILDDLERQFGEHGLTEHFKSIEADIVDHLSTYRRFGTGMVEQLPPQLVAQVTEEREALLRRYSVNLFVTHGTEPPAGAPVVDERHYGYQTLFGWIDYENRFGVMVTDFTKIRPGAIQIANGGFLILQIQDLLVDPRSWVKLKRVLKSREARFDDPWDIGIPIPVAGLQPQGIPIDVKVILVGTPLIFALLDALDPDFAELFKVRAEFEPDTRAEQDSIRSYVAFVRRTVDRCGLRHFNERALEEIVRHGQRMAGRQDRLSARYGLIADLCQEANQMAASEGADEVGPDHVGRALQARRTRSSLVPDRLRQMIAEGTLHIETAGAVVGQVNGLAVYAIGGHEFGTPTRITCRTGAGRRGIIAIERETERSGAIHTKGVLVLSGYLQGTFGARRPLAFTASLTFEQSYDEVEGDSASSAELVAILTSLAGVPIRQDIAVTGSVDQFGNIQPVGGVTEKVEGFFDVCSAVGLTGTQGVILPATNVANLTLRQDVLEAIGAGRFHIWAVSRIEQTIELLTGLPAGELDSNGLYPLGTVYGHVTEALTAMAGEEVRTDADDGHVH